MIVESPERVAELARALRASVHIPLDVESNGLHAYRAVLCTLQLGLVPPEVSASDQVAASAHGAASFEVFVVDALALGDAALAPLADVLGPEGPKKIVHDLAFDARMLRKHGLPLGNVIDTAIAARFLGIAQGGLASLAESKLGVKLSKELQHHDWGRRPLTADVLPYLAADVAHLPALARILFDEARERDIVPEIEAETEYRLSTALVEESDERPAYVRIKGVQALDELARAILRRVAAVREEAAERWNVPPFKVIGNDVLLAIARTRKVEPVRGRGASLSARLRQELALAMEEGGIPAEDQRWFVEPPPPPKIDVQARRAREQRLTAWRKRVAKERSLDEQVILPGHCLQDLADRAPGDLEGLSGVPGIGARRVLRDGQAILGALAAIP